MPYATDHVGAPPVVVADVSQAVSDLESELVELSDDLHAHPEEGYAEHRSVDGAAGLALVVADVLLDDDLRGDVAAALQRQAPDEGTLA